MVGTTPAPEALARWLLTHEAGTNPTPEAVAAAAERVHARLREGLPVFLGRPASTRCGRGRCTWPRARNSGWRRATAGQGAAPPDCLAW